jgi:hypothetical protein
MTDKLLTVEEAADRLGTSVGCLARGDDGLGDLGLAFQPG